MKVDVLIVGAGFAGAGTAFHLTQAAPGLRILLLEKEEIPGFHASGRNASLVLQSVENPGIRRIVRDSVAAYLQRRHEVGYEPVGSLLLGTPAQLAKLRDTSAVESRLLEPGEAAKIVPLLQGHRFAQGLLTPSDGVMDVSRLLDFYLAQARERGLQLGCRTEVTGAERGPDGWRVETSAGPVQCRVVVNGAGAWAPEVADRSGVTPLPMKSFKRHLFILEGMPVDPAMPYTWSVDRGFYFRPESGGLLFSVCDEELATSGFVQTISPGILERLAELISAELPELEDARERRVWSCFRTKTPNGSFHLGWAEDVPGFLWVAGLGGHGMGASWEVGRRAATLLAEYLGQS